MSAYSMFCRRYVRLPEIRVSFGRNSSLRVNYISQSKKRARNRRPFSLIYGRVEFAHLRLCN